MFSDDTTRNFLMITLGIVVIILAVLMIVTTLTGHLHKHKRFRISDHEERVIHEELTTTDKIIIVVCSAAFGLLGLLILGAGLPVRSKNGT